MLRAGVVVGLSVSLFASSAFAADAQPNWPDLGRPAAVGGGENDAALVIGIEDYQHVADIPGAVQNARDWYRYLVDGRKVPVRAVRLLRNGEADRETMLQAAKDMAAQVKPGGTFWVVFIGHGAPSQDGKEGVLIGSDAKQTAVSLFARSVRQSELQAQVGSTPAVMLFDSCFSGRAHTGAALAAGLQPLILTKAMAPATTTLLTAAQADQFAGGLPGKDRPAFSYLMLGALRGWGDANGDGQVTATEALEYATKALAVLPIGRTQTPELVGGGASRVLAARAFEREPDLDAIITGEFRPADVPAAPPEPMPVAIAPTLPPPPAAPLPIGKRGEPDTPRRAAERAERPQSTDSLSSNHRPTADAERVTQASTGLTTGPGGTTVVPSRDGAPVASAGNSNQILSPPGQTTEEQQRSVVDETVHKADDSVSRRADPHHRLEVGARIGYAVLAGDVFGSPVDAMTPVGVEIDYLPAASFSVGAYLRYASWNRLHPDCGYYCYIDRYGGTAVAGMSGFGTGLSAHMLRRLGPIRLSGGLYGGMEIARASVKTKFDPLTYQDVGQPGYHVGVDSAVEWLFGGARVGVFASGSFVRLVEATAPYDGGSASSTFTVPGYDSVWLQLGLRGAFGFVSTAD
jgi:hypothetical protein